LRISPRGVATTGKIPDKITNDWSAGLEIDRDKTNDWRAGLEMTAR